MTKESVSDDKPLIFFFFDPARDINEINYVKNLYPQAKLISFGGDVHYININSFKHIWEACDLHIDTMFSVKPQIELYTKYDHYFWTLSETAIEEIYNHNSFPEKTNDVIFLGNVVTNFRKQFFSNLKRTYKVLCHLKEFDYDKVLNHYKSTYITLESTTPCADFWSKHSMKGFRAWVGPFCDSVSICNDDLKNSEMEELSDIIYWYNSHNLHSVINELKSNEKLRLEYINKQREWILNNTIEKQLKKIIDKHFM